MMFTETEEDKLRAFVIENNKKEPFRVYIFKETEDGSLDGMVGEIGQFNSAVYVFTVVVDSKALDILYKGDTHEPLESYETGVVGSYTLYNLGNHLLYHYLVAKTYDVVVRGRDELKGHTVSIEEPLLSFLETMYTVREVKRDELKDVDTFHDWIT